MLSKILNNYQWRWSPGKKTAFAMFYLFGFVSGSFQQVLARYGLFWIGLLFTSDSYQFIKTLDLQIYKKSTSC